MAHHETAPVDEFEATMEQTMEGPGIIHDEAVYEDPAFWVAISFVIFVGVLIFIKLPAMAAKFLDKRSEGISAQLKEARQLREEAQTLLASYERQQRDAETEVQEILDHAQVEAERATKDAQIALQAVIARREAQAQDKIAQAEAAAVKEVRNVAVDVAVATASKLIAETMAAEQSDTLVDKAISDLQQHLN
jgi:F-type H+-transporting ATPase subunit b